MLSSVNKENKIANLEKEIENETRQEEDSILLVAYHQDEADQWTE